MARARGGGMFRTRMCEAAVARCAAYAAVVALLKSQVSDERTALCVASAGFFGSQQRLRGGRGRLPGCRVLNCG